MGRGSSGSGGGGGAQGSPANTPSGVSYDDFMKMPESQRIATMENIISNPAIQVPNYLDNSDTSKVLYALGMNNKPTVVSDAQLDAMQGRELFRTVYESSSMPPPSSDAILDQIRNGDYTQMSGSGGSAHGRALYFATDFYGSAVYGHGKKNALISRSKINSNAKIVSQSTLTAQMQQKGFHVNGTLHTDQRALYAISQGIDGWYSSSYTMIINRGALTMSSTNKSIRSGRGYANDWQSANTKK